MKNVTAKKVLIVDDDVDLLMLLERLLNKQEIIVETAASLPEAEDILSGFVPDLVLLDINVKGEDGRKLCWQLKNSLINLKVIIMSGYDYSISRAALFGADELIPKPINTEFLLHRINSFLTESKVSSK
jgi:DNA-binding response OmpR family regulator